MQPIHQYNQYELTKKTWKKFQVLKSWNSRQSLSGNSYTIMGQAQAKCSGSKVKGHSEKKLPPSRGSIKSWSCTPRAAHGRMCMPPPGLPVCPHGLSLLCLCSQPAAGFTGAPCSWIPEIPSLQLWFLLPFHVSGLRGLFWGLEYCHTVSSSQAFQGYPAGSLCYPHLQNKHHVDETKVSHQCEQEADPLG